MEQEKYDKEQVEFLLSCIRDQTVWAVNAANNKMCNCTEILCSESLLYKYPTCTIGRQEWLREHIRICID